MRVKGDVKQQINQQHTSPGLSLKRIPKDHCLPIYRQLSMMFANTQRAFLRLSVFATSVFAIEDRGTLLDDNIMSCQ